MNITLRRHVVNSLIFLIVAAFALAMTQANAYGATRITLSGCDNVTAGETFTAKVKFVGDGTSSVEGQIGYDVSKLEYISGGSNSGNYGYIELNKSGGDGSVTFNIKFKALTGGSTGLDISSSNILDYNKNPLDNCSISKIIKIGGAAKAGDEVVNETEPVIEDDDETETEATETSIVESSYEEPTQGTTVDQQIEETRENSDINLLFVAVPAITLIVIALIAIILMRSRRKRG